MDTKKIIEIMRYLTLHTPKMTDAKLMKMISLSDKHSIQECGSHISPELFFRINRDPLSSHALEMVNNSDTDFLEYFHPPKKQKDKHDSAHLEVLSIELAHDCELVLVTLSECEQNILDTIISQFAHMSTYNIITYTPDRRNKKTDRPK
ncbi:MAG: DUF4065 domain-containing protein [Campylobacterota bacterium]|nr:DUF4065 domain-containing protein [Campylobacterota bacterium]